MIIYNITINIDASVHEDWLQWMKTNHIPDVMRTGMFNESRFLRVLGDDESGGYTYSVQYVCDNMERYKQYEDIYAPALRGEYNIRYKDKFVAFRTLLETVD
jgi:hypothetical protein